MFELKVDINLAVKDIFKRHKRLPAPHQIVDKDYLTLLYELSSPRDIGLFGQENLPIPIGIIDKELNNSSIAFRDGILLILPINCPNIIDRYKEIEKSNRFPDSISEEGNLQILTVIHDKDLDFFLEHKSYYALDDCSHHKIDNHHVYKQKFPIRHKQADILVNKRDRYRLYLNDRLLTERMWLPDIDLRRKIWQESVVLDRLPENSEIRIETSARLQIEKIQLNDNTSFPNAKSAWVAA